MKTIRIIYRLFYLLATNLIFILIGLALNLLFKNNHKNLQQKVAKFAKKWAKWICKSLNIEITIHGEIPNFNCALIVANHVGSPDIFILGACFQVVFISKAEVRDWPLIGLLAYLGHTIFVNRKKKQQVRKTIFAIKDLLNLGFSVLLFPEAGVTDGHNVHPFKSVYFESAILSGKPVLPVMISYEDSENSKVAQWGNQSFFSHIIALLKNKKLICINDSKATSFEATLQSLLAFKKIYWIVGGLPKYRDRFNLKNVKKHIFRAYIIGKNTAFFQEQIKNLVPYTISKNIKNAVNNIYKNFKSSKNMEGTILLSPAAASFDQFNNFEKRGAYFKKIINKKFIKS